MIDTKQIGRQIMYGLCTLYVIWMLSLLLSFSLIPIQNLYISISYTLLFIMAHALLL